MILPALLLAAAAGAVERPVARVQFSCAPWDGPALHVQTDSSAVSLQATIWGLGYDQLRQGIRRIELNNGEGVKNSGQGWVCPPKAKDYRACKQERLIVEFYELDLKLKGRARGQVRAPGGPWLPFNVLIDPQPALCG